MKKFNLFVGLATLSLAFVLNAQHALNNYGVSDPNNKLSPMVLAQTMSWGAGGVSNGVCDCGLGPDATHHPGNCKFWENIAGDGNGEGLDTRYNRHPHPCTIVGNGRIQVIGGTVIRVNGSLSIDGGIYCTSSGNATCKPIECAELWQWIFD